MLKLALIHRLIETLEQWDGHTDGCPVCKKFEVTQHDLPCTVGQSIICTLMKVLDGDSPHVRAD